MARPESERLDHRRLNSMTKPLSLPVGSDGLDHHVPEFLGRHQTSPTNVAA